MQRLGNAAVADLNAIAADDRTAEGVSTPSRKSATKQEVCNQKAFLVLARTSISFSPALLLLLSLIHRAIFCVPAGKPLLRNTSLLLTANANCPPWAGGRDWFGVWEG